MVKKKQAQFCRIHQKKFINEKHHTEKYHKIKVGDREVMVAQDYIDWYED